MLDEIADAQILMCESLEASLSLTLEAFANVELNEATRVKIEAEKQTNVAEALLARYLQRGPLLLERAASGSGAVNVGNSAVTSSTVVDDFNAAVSSNWHKISDQVGVSSFFRSSTYGRSSSDFVDSDTGRANHKGKRKTSTSSKKSGNSTDEHTSGDHNNKCDNVQSAFAAASMRKMLEEIRLAHANAELSRFHLLRRLDSLKVRSKSCVVILLTSLLVWQTDFILLNIIAAFFRR